MPIKKKEVIKIMNKEEAIKILMAYAICNLENSKFTCLDCPFNGELFTITNRTYLLCDYNKNVTTEKVINAVNILNSTKF